MRHKRAARHLELVARGNERHARLGQHRHGHHVAACDARGNFGRYRFARMRQHIARMHTRAHGTRARKTRRRRCVDFNMLLICGNLHMFNDDRRIEAIGHGGASVGEFPIDATHPCRGIGRDIAFEIVVMHSDGIHCACERVRRVELRRHVGRKHAPRRIGDGNLLHAQRRLFNRAHGGRKTASVEHATHRLFPRQLYMVGMVSHDVLPFRKPAKCSERLTGWRI